MKLLHPCFLSARTRQLGIINQEIMNPISSLIFNVNIGAQAEAMTFVTAIRRRALYGCRMVDRTCSCHSSSHDILSILGTPRR